MNVTRPEAESEYSRGLAGSEGDLRAAGDGEARAPGPPLGGVTRGLVLGGVLGALLLLAAELTPLLSVRTSLSLVPIKTVSTGSHDSFALVPLALLALALTYGAGRSGTRLALMALGLMGVAALLIALLGDLPDATASGLVGNPATATATASPQIGFYLETLGAVLLVLAAGAGILLSPGGPPPTRSAS